jgi:hypothetical protein
VSRTVRWELIARDPNTAARRGRLTTPITPNTGIPRTTWPLRTLRAAKGTWSQPMVTKPTPGVIPGALPGR